MNVSARRQANTSCTCVIVLRELCSYVDVTRIIHLSGELRAVCANFRRCVRRSSVLVASRRIDDTDAVNIGAWPVSCRFWLQLIGLQLCTCMINLISILSGCFSHMPLARSALPHASQVRIIVRVHVVGIAEKSLNQREIELSTAARLVNAPMALSDWLALVGAELSASHLDNQRRDNRVRKACWSAATHAKTIRVGRCKFSLAESCRLTVSLGQLSPLYARPESS